MPRSLDHNAMMRARGLRDAADEAEGDDALDEPRDDDDAGAPDAAEDAGAAGVAAPSGAAVAARSAPGRKSGPGAGATQGRRRAAPVAARARGPGMARRSAAQWVDCLDGDPVVRDLLDQGRTLREIQQRLALAVPGLRLVVVSLAGTTLTVAAPGHAGAAKLRQCAPSVVDAIREGGWPIERLRIRPRLPVPEPAPPRVRERPPLPETALQAIAHLRQQVEDPELQAALARMEARHRRQR